MEQTSSKPSLAHLPYEILSSIGEFLCAIRDVHALVLTNRRFRKIFNQRLYVLDSEPPIFENRALNWAVCKGELDVARRAIDAGANVDLSFWPRRNLLSDDGAHWLAEVETYKYYINRHDDLRYIREGDKCRPSVSYKKAVPKSLTSPLVQAVRLGNMAMARLLIDAGANVNLSPCDTRTPLAVAIERKSLPMVQLLVETGRIHLNMMYHDCRALGLAAYYDSPEIVEYLLPKITDADELCPEPADIRSGPEMAILHERDKILKILLAHPGLDPSKHVLGTLTLRKLPAFKIIWAHEGMKKRITPELQRDALMIAALQGTSDTVAFLKDDMRKRFPEPESKFKSWKRKLNAWKGKFNS